MIHRITDENFIAEVLESKLPCVILFTGSWCDWCPEMIIRMEEASVAFDGQVRFCSVDIDSERKLRIAFAVGTLPYIVWIREGMKTPLFDEIVTVDRLVERVAYMLDGGKPPLETPIRFK